MKRNFLITLTLLVCAMAVYATGSVDKFIYALRNCSQYRELGTINVEGITAQSSKSISGWQNEKCIYKENLIISGMNTNVTCRFSRPQIKEISSVADAYFLTLKYSNEGVDTSSLEAAKNTPLANVFNKYLQDPQVCTISGME